MIVTLLFSLIVFTMRGVFWAPMDEVGIPERPRHRLRNRMPGRLCTGDVRLHRLRGNPRCESGAGGYHIVFIVLAALALVGAIVSSGLVRVARTRRAMAEV